MNQTDTEIIPVITRYLRGEASELEKGLLIRWLEASEENRRFFSDLAANYSLHQTLSDEAFGRRSEDMALRLKARIDGEEPKQRNLRRFLLAFAAAAAVAVAVVTSAFFLQHTRTETIDYQAMANTSEDVKAFRLDDGTQVWLRPGARIRYNVSGLSDRRVVNLEGQAYFDVARDEARPLTVVTPTIGVRVLGTAFSVSSGATRSQVVLERGSVRILSGEGTSLVSLTPGQKATYDAHTGDVTVDAIYAEAYVTQHYNLISLSDVTLPEILSRLEARFGVKIRSGAADLQKRYTVNYLKTDSLEDILSIVEYLTGAHCEIINN